MNNYCLVCDSHLKRDLTWTTLIFPTIHSPICTSCKAKLQLITGERCRICSRSLDTLNKTFIKNDVCMDCVRWEQDPQWANTLKQNISMYHYNEFLKDVMALLKFRGDYQIAEIFAQTLAKELKKLQFDWVVTIPLSTERLQERGFNQTEALAQMAGQETKDCLKRIHSEKQSKKSRGERLRQKQIFQFQGNREEIKERNIVLLDDIYTTGTTLRQAAKVLKAAGAKDIQAITMARG
ncbi:ComF family protein [Bacillus sp. SD088]|nr:ComF family protein [Bacillus sp. SD088]